MTIIQRRCLECPTNIPGYRLLCRFCAKSYLLANTVRYGDCWLWKKLIPSTGYGSLGHNRYGHRLAHRFAYEYLVGPIPPGLEIDHLCRNRACANPDHLEAVTHRENIIRGHKARGTWRGAA